MPVFYVDQFPNERVTSARATAAAAAAAVRSWTHRSEQVRDRRISVSLLVHLYDLSPIAANAANDMQHGNKFTYYLRALNIKECFSETQDSVSGRNGKPMRGIFLCNFFFWKETHD